MIITIAQQKGGVGKTTIAILLANYLANKKHQVTILDFDKQGTASYFYKKSLESNSEDLPYIVEQINDTNIKYLMNQDSLNAISKSKDIFIVDTAGRINEDYIRLLLTSDVVLVPFAYTEAILHSTIKFTKYCKHVDSELNIVFLANKVFLPRKSFREKVYTAWNGIDEILSQQGKVLKSRIFDQRNMESLNTLNNNYRQQNNVSDAFNELYELINLEQ